MQKIIPYSKELKIYARELRKNMTIHEKILWKKIRRKQIQGVKFYRQKIIGTFILDFYADNPKLAIELDGNQHLLLENMERDINRDAYLNTLGIFVLRYKNIEISERLQNTLLDIEKTIEILKKTIKRLD